MKTIAMKAVRAASCIISRLGDENARNKMVKGLLASLFGAIAVSCGGCGGGGGGSTAPSAAVQAPPKPVQISLYGDSTMAGLQFINGAYVVTKVLRADLEGDLQTSLGTSVTVVENDQSGTTLRDLLQGLRGYQTFATYMQTDKSQIIVENFGINDWGAYSVDEFQQNLNSFIALAQAAGKKVVLEEPNPVCEKGTADQEQVLPNGNTIGQFVSVIDSTAGRYGLPLIKQYDQIKAMPNWCSLMSD